MAQISQHYRGANHLRLGGAGRAGTLGRKHDTSFVDPLNDWKAEGRDVGNFAWSMWNSVPLMQILVETRIDLTLGSCGIRFQSTYETDDNGTYTDVESDRQDALTDWVAGTYKPGAICPNRVISRLDIERQIARAQLLSGNGWAVRLLRPGRPTGAYRNRWRVVEPFRVQNPPLVNDFERPEWQNKGGKKLQGEPGSIIFQGVEMTKDWDRLAIWIDVSPPAQYGIVANDDRKFIRVEWFDRKGEPNVIHRANLARPGQILGFPEVSPFIYRMLQIDGLGEAHIIGSRVKASYPIGIRTSDTKIAKQYQQAGSVIGPNMRHSPGKTFFLGDDGEMVFPNVSYDGKEYKEFVEPAIRELAADWGIPWQYAMRHIEGVSMASGRVFMAQTEETAEKFQESHRPAVTEIIDRQAIREGLARGLISGLSAADLDAASGGVYKGPRPADLDPVGTAKRADLMLQHNVSETTVYDRMYRLDYESEMQQKARDKDTRERYGVDPVVDTEIIPAAGGDAPEDENDDDENDNAPSQEDAE